MPIVREVPVAREGEIAVGAAKSFRFGLKNGIAYNDNGTVKAFVNFCTHMGGPVDLVSGCRFRCRWHDSDFDATSGKRISGEAPEGTALETIPLHLKDGMLYATVEYRDEFDF